MTITKTARVEAQQELVRRDAFSVAGVAALFTQDNKSGIPGLWPRLFQKLPLKDQVGQVSYGVCSMIDRDEGSFKYLAGVEVKGETPLPEGFERVTLEPQSYAVYRIVLDGSDLHAQMQAAMPIIWGDMLPKSGRRLAPAPDFEFYPPGFSPNREGAYVDIYVPVEA
jgi:AraC family transcriptional regulator